MTTGSLRQPDDFELFRTGMARLLQNPRNVLLAASPEMLTNLDHLLQGRNRFNQAGIELSIALLLC